MLLLGAAWGLAVALLHIGWPYSVDFGEGLTLTGALKIAGGGLGAGYAYVDRYYQAPLLDYPPLYPLLVAGLYKLGVPLLVAGRGLAVVSCLAVGGMVGLLAKREGATRWLVAACVLLPLGGYPFLMWAGVGRIDALGIALTLGGCYLATSKQEASARLNLVAAALCFALAIFTKQSMVAAPTAVVLAGLSLAGERKRAVWLAGLTGAFAGLLLLAMQTATDGAYLNIVTAERNAAFSSLRAAQNYAVFAGIFAALVLLAAVGWWRLRRATTLGQRAIFIYWPAAWLVAATVGKFGSAEYYFMELLAVTILLAVIGYTQPDRASWSGWRLAGFSGASLAQAMMLAAVVATGQGIELHGFQREAAARQVVAALQSAAGADVFCDVPGLLLVAGRADQVYDRYILRQLTRAGLRDDAAEVADLRRKRWAVVVLSFDPFASDPGGDWDAGSWPPDFLAAVQQGYQTVAIAQGKDGTAQYWLLKPRQ